MTTDHTTAMITQQVPYWRTRSGNWHAQAETIDHETLCDRIAALAEMETNIRRRAWAAAYRDAADRLTAIGLTRGADALRDLADRIEAGELTPWAETAPETALTSTESAEPATHGPPDAQAGSQGADDQTEPCPDPDCGCCYPLGVHPALRDGQAGIVGRALMVPVQRHGVTTGTLWREAPDGPGPGEWWYAGGYGYATRSEVEEEAAEAGSGPVREVLLVAPNVATEGQANLAPGADAPSQPGPDLAPAAADGPGWDRATIDSICRDALGEPHPETDQVRALLADRDRLAAQAKVLSLSFERFIKDRGDALAELAELRAHAEATDNALADARTELDQRGAALTEADRELRELRHHLATARRDGASDALDAASRRLATGAGPGSPATIVSAMGAEIRGGGTIPTAGGQPAPTQDGGSDE